MLLLSPEPVSDVEPRRAARVAFGSGLIAMMAVLVTASLADYTYWLHASTILLVGWPTSIAFALAASAIARRRHVDVSLSTSLVLPVVGLALALPITLHLPFVAVFLGPEDFDHWVGASIVIVGFAHIVLAVLAGAFARARASGRRGMSPWAIYGWVNAAGCLPGIALFAIPSVLVAATALPFVSILRAASAIAERERAAPSLPRAMLHSDHSFAKK